jgi:hemolysin III
VVTSHVETRGEEVVNALTHGLGCVAACKALHFFADSLTLSSRAGLGAIVFAASMAALLFFSSLYHAWPSTPLKPRLQKLDHACIFLFIAGSYSPFCLLALPPAIGHSVLQMAWGSAFLGASYSLSGGNRYPNLTMALLFAQASAAFLLLPHFWVSLTAFELTLLLLGGACYGLGSIFFATHWFRFSHAVWHLFVLLGCVCHFFCVAHLVQRLG